VLETLYIGKRIIELDVIDSTNNFASELIRSEKVINGTVVVTHYQNAGKGQRGNAWYSEPGKNLTFSLVLKPKLIGVKDAFILSKLVSLAICKYLENVVDEEVFIKWPNDIYVGDKKICGILIENQFRGNRIEYAIVGVGLNVNQSEFEGLNTATSLLLQQKAVFDVKKVLFGVLKNIELMDLKFQNNPNEINQLYLDNLLFYKQFRDYNTIHGNVNGKIIDVLQSGKLQLETNAGEMLEFDLKEIEFIL